MAINVRTKGQTGEREICDFFNSIYAEVYAALHMPLPPKPIAQRNQNQSAVGGCDISNTCFYAVEVKRQEALSINTWWRQCLVSALEVNKFPVLIYRQNKQKWKVILFMNPIMLFADEKHHHADDPPRCEISLDDFRVIFKAHALEYIKRNGSAT
jgi:hypothetical protein